MANLLQKLVDFASQTEYADLPEAVVHETKRVFLDSIGCALNGLSSERGQIGVKLARRLGGPPESTIIGTGDRVSWGHAAFANSELINALDHDVVLGWHLPPLVIPPPLAIAESTSTSGKNLILAIALGHEIAARIERALVPHGGFTLEETSPGIGSVKLADVYGCGSSIFGVVAGAGKIFGLNPEKMAHAMGIGGYISAPSTARKWNATTPIPMVKYGATGWIGAGAITAVLLADMGYTGDTEIFEGEYGYHRFSAMPKWEPELILKGLGTEWGCLMAIFKRYPCGFCMAAAVDLFSEIIEEYDLKPEDIEEVRAFPFPGSELAFATGTETVCEIGVKECACGTGSLISPDDYCFNDRYMIACAAHKVPYADFHDLKTKQDPKILEFMEKLSIPVNSQDFLDFMRDSFTAMKKDPLALLARVEVVANGNTLKKEVLHRKGMPFPEECRMKDEEVLEKFRNNALKVLPSHKVEKTLQSVWELEKLENVTQLMETVVP